ncbi:ABC transport system ATP-binding/permease protein [Candidatus Hakubella thermalkaliphila]|uniref:ABC transport system ATP-binding/permease protein n=1 Tax=Candidatus Hakubella thermalkaliphila TaxID=2754717 RepID=A0A6V8NZ86_9ACTN|nr:ABC transport system ATP-binding/permease protein [Candidatus Hakubella thermalkaliphila]
MSLLKDLEDRLETILEGFFARTFRGGLQPIEIASRLTKELRGKKVIGISYTYVPNRFKVFINPEDKERFSSYENAIKKELVNYLISYARSNSLSFITRPSIKFIGVDTVPAGQVRVEGIITEDNQQPIPEEALHQQTRVMDLRELELAASARHILVLLDSEGRERKYPVNKKLFCIGRSEDNDLVIKDPSVSRHHAEMSLDGNDRAWIVDRDSTNGTAVNGAKVTRARLEEGDVISLGTSKLIYQTQ